LRAPLPKPWRPARCVMKVRSWIAFAASAVIVSAVAVSDEGAAD
jgi:hypothetical protein